MSLDGPATSCCVYIQLFVTSQSYICPMKFPQQTFIEYKTFLNAKYNSFCFYDFGTLSNKSLKE